MNKILLLGLSSCFALSANAVTIVSSVSDLTFAYSGGASEAGSSAGSLSIESAKNSDAIASLPASYELGVGETMTISFDMQFDNVLASTSSTFDIRFADGLTFYGVRLNPVTTTNAITFDETSNTNLGKFSTDAGMGTNVNTLTFEVERTGLEEMTLSFSSPQISSTERSRTSTGVPVDSVFSQLAFEFTGSGWNEDFGGSMAIATITNLTIDTTGTVIPEPSTYAMMIGASVLALGIMRRRKQ
ncbi:PEP-CTERM sorting domain-containing protein [Cerasicoccus fimbriatus]|uniref:PEP-CTERM sorting domain-containing protein n=1 Tax=Cerasicoccus fimbriatus TaxID=3014554 RepID=UPI0022B427F6|nr:PEP-CTERM sorting domain-containing protein [Cerasicoccus sp. TK19100]